MVNLSKETTISLRKHEDSFQQVVSLLKLNGIIARVVMVLDISGSMRNQYSDSTVDEILLRAFAVARKFDDNQCLDSYIFSNDFVRLPEISVHNLEGYIKREILYKFKGKYYDFLSKEKQYLQHELKQIEESLKPKSGFFGFGKSKEQISATEKERLLQEKQKVEDDLNLLQDSKLDKRMQIFGDNNEPRVMTDIVQRYTVEEPSDLPTYVFFVSDGGVSQNEDIRRIVRDSSDKPIFWQFVGSGLSNYGALEELDNLSGRVVDNANFFAIDDLNQISDEELYERMFVEFPIWIKEAKQKGILK